MGNVSSFVAIASQLILIKSRALLPRRRGRGAGRPADEGPDPEAELRARLILYRAFRDAGGRLLDEAQARVGLFHREATTARTAGLAGARPPAAAPLSAQVLVDALDGLARVAPPPPPPPETIRRTCRSPTAPQLIRRALRGADVVVLQDLLAGVQDRVVVAVTFLAMLELMKRREIVVEQAEPWGPIMARRTTPEERAAAAFPGDRRGGTAGRVAGVVRMTATRMRRPADGRPVGGSRRWRRGCADARGEPDDGRRCARRAS